MSTKSERRANRLARKTSKSSGKQSPSKGQSSQEKQGDTGIVHAPEAQPIVAVQVELKSEETADNQQAPPKKHKGKCKRILYAINWQIVFNGVVAAFTAVIAFATWYQWGATVAQNNIMIDQGKAIEKQAKLAEGQLQEAKAGSAQTDLIIDEMRLERRAWLAVKPEIGDLIPNQKPKCTLWIANTGKTPGTIEKTIVTSFSTTVPIDFDRIMKEHTTVSSQQMRETVVAPGGTIRFVLNDSPLLNDADIAAINKGTGSIVVVATVDYLDSMKTHRTSQCCYVYDVASKSMFVFEKYNFMK
jgi:hypothetical protein